jgi:hypothetical protein
MNTIELGKEVVISDPCYTIPTWCQVVLDNVKEGKYKVEVLKQKCGSWGERCSQLIVVHVDHIGGKLEWKELSNDIGVDSGQCGIFSKETYRNDNYDLPDGDGEFDYTPDETEEGDKWYGKICTHTLGKQQYGMYDKGVVSTSGYGDGSYTLYVKMKGKEVVGMLVDFGVEEDE